MLQSDEHVGCGDGMCVRIFAVDKKSVGFPDSLGKHPVHRKGGPADVCLVEPQPGVVPDLPEVDLHGVLLG